MCKICVPNVSIACPCRIHVVSGHHRIPQVFVIQIERVSYIKDEVGEISVQPIMCSREDEKLVKWSSCMGRFGVSCGNLLAGIDLDLASFQYE